MVSSGLAIISPIYSDITLKYRPTNIFFYFAVPFFHLSIGYEMTFFALLGVHVLSFVELSAATEDHSIPVSVYFRSMHKWFLRFFLLISFAELDKIS